MRANHGPDNFYQAFADLTDEAKKKEQNRNIAVAALGGLLTGVVLGFLIKRVVK